VDWTPLQLEEWHTRRHRAFARLVAEIDALDKLTQEIETAAGLATSDDDAPEG
jgi:hypothetical protein